VAKALAFRLGLDHFSSGDFMREMATERGLTVLELSAAAESNPDVDLEIDRRTARLGMERTGFVMDSRLAWHFIPHSVRVFLDVDIMEAARRIFTAGRESEVENVDLASTMRSTIARQASESRRYQRYYGIDYLRLDQYDIVIDTTGLAVDEVVDRIVERLGATGEGPCGPSP
jgi:predicted cytidylate kinase